MRIQLLSVFALLSFAAGCASYNSSSAPALNATTAKVTYNQDGVGLIADPYLDAQRQTKYFNADFKKSGMLVVHLLVKNEGADAIEVRRSNIHLRLPDGTEIADMGATTAATQVGENGSVVGATIAFGLVGALIASNAEDAARNARIADYTTKEFKDRTLLPHDNAQGFVFFRPGPGTPPFDTGVIVVNVLDRQANRDSQLTFTMNKLAFNPTPVDKTSPNDGQNNAALVTR